MSGVPKIREAEATPKCHPALNNSTQTTTSDNRQNSDQNQTSKQDPTNTVNNNPEQDSTNSNPQNEAPKLDSTNANPQNGTSKQDTENNHPNSKRDSACLPLPGLFAPKRAKSQFKKPAGVPESANAYSKEELAKSIQAEINYIQDEAEKLHNYKYQVEKQVKEASERLEMLRKEEDQDFRSLRDLQIAVTKLKLQIPKQKGDMEEKGPHKDQQAGLFKQRSIPPTVMRQMPRLYKDDLFVNSPEFKDLEARFNQLPVALKLCLLCFSIFPGNEIIKKRLMVYWWMSEGFVPPIPRNEETKRQIADGKTAEAFAEEFFEELRKKGFIEPVNEKRSLTVGSYRVHAFIRSALVILAEKAKFFDFDEGEPTEKFALTFQSCLVGRGLIDYQDLREGKVKVQDLEKLHTVINVNEAILEFKKEWLLEMKNVNVLYLGRWKASATHHIEVEDEEEKDFLDGLQNMHHLKYFSLQGVSRIMELPESISKLSNLMILDLRACHSLESIPEKIGLLKNLTHLDISECYLLERMPKGIASLSELRVLKGFVVVRERSKHLCNLQDLAEKLKKLIKLTIYTGVMEFPEETDIEAFQKFKVLRKLTIAWGGDALKVPTGKSTSEAAKQHSGGERKENTKEKQGFASQDQTSKSISEADTKEKGVGVASQAQSSKDSESPKPDDGVERKEKNSKEIKGALSSKPQSSIRASEAPKPDDRGERKEDTKEKRGENASQSSKTSESSKPDGGGEIQKESPKEIQEEGALQAQSRKSTTEAPKPDDGGERQKETPKEIQEEGALQAQSIITTEAPELDDGGERHKETPKEIQEDGALHAQSNKSTSELASKPESGEERMKRTSKEIQGRGTSHAPSSKSTTETAKQDGGKRKDEKAEGKGKAFNKQKTFAKSLTFKRSPHPPTPPPPQLPASLEKLDLKSFPKAITPDWLMPSTLKSLKKLYIRGGKFSDLGQYQYLDDWGAGGGTKPWNVEILRLKYLRELEMDWKELQELFPNLIYLEKVNCPKLSFFPCDGYGVWINQIKLKEMQKKA